MPMLYGDEWQVLSLLGPISFLITEMREVGIPAYFVSTFGFLVWYSHCCSTSDCGLFAVRTLGFLVVWLSVGYFGVSFYLGIRSI